MQTMAQSDEEGWSAVRQKKRKKEMDPNGDFFDGYDLLSPTFDSKYFRVSFDWHTPRPHFLITIKDVHRGQLKEFESATSLNDYPSDFLAELIDVAERMVKIIRSVCPHARGPDYDQPNASTDEQGDAPIVLSIRRGYWVTRKVQNFCAHICVDVDSYLEFFDQKTKDIRAIPAKFVTTRWNHKPPETLDDVGRSCYKRSVREPTAKRRILLRDIDKIGVVSITLEDKSALDGAIFHEKYSRLGFKVDKKLELLKKLEESAVKLKLAATTSGGELYGCHLCVAVESNKIFTGYQHAVNGYLQLSSAVFYCLLPDECSRARWKEQYTRSNEIIMT